jgi:hypothetical protein
MSKLIHSNSLDIGGVKRWLTLNNTPKVSPTSNKRQIESGEGIDKQQGEEKENEGNRKLGVANDGGPSNVSRWATRSVVARLMEPRVRDSERVEYARYF